MAWNVGLGRARSWLAAAMVCSGCTAINPAYDGGMDATASEESTTRTTVEGVEGTEGTQGTQTGSNETGQVDGGSGPASCEGEAPMGVEVSVAPVGGVPAPLCGQAIMGIGLLEATAGGYTLFRDPNCQRTEPLPLSFSPKGPSLNTGVDVCVAYELRYRPDCSFESVVIGHFPQDGRLIFAAATFPASHVAELEPELVEKVCDCTQAECCPGVDQPGLYALRASWMGKTGLFGQGEQELFNSGTGAYELGVMQARITDRCEDPVQFDWYFRQLSAG